MTRLSIFVPSPIRVGPNVPRSIVVHGADLDVVADLDVAELRHLDVPAVLEAVAEPVGPEHGVGVDDHAVAEDGVVVEHDVRVEDDVVAEPAVAADDGPAREAGSGRR